MSKIKAGQVFATKEGGSVVVLEYRGCNEILIQHQDSHEYICVAQAKELRVGGIKNPFYPSVYGVGYVGVGQYRVSVGGKHMRPYVVWKSMMSRAYCKNFQKSNQTYTGCSVAKVWHNYQKFAAWYEKQPNAYLDGFDLDKDLIVFGNRVYSPKACSLVPRAVNALLTDSRKARGDLPQGVSRRGKKYQVRMGIDGKHTYIGIRSTPEEASELYRSEKAKQVKIVAEQYKNALHSKVYKNLMEWELI